MILDQIASHLHLDLPKNIEIGIEIDPRTVTVDDIRELSSVGFNRFSVGVQDFCHSVQKAINRVQDYDHTLAIINECKRVSDSVNVDLVTGLPNQSTDTFAETLTTIAEHQVDRVAVYNFAFLPNKIPAQKMIQPSTLPSLDERLRLTGLVNDSLGQSGYQHIGMDHFALEEDSLCQAWRDDTLHRNFMGYTTKRDTDLIGFGASAISKFDSAYAQNHTSLRDYVDEIEREQLPIARGISLNEDDRIRAAVIQQIMCRQAVDLQQPIGRLSGRPTNQTLSDYFAPELEALTSFCEDGLIEIGKSEFRLTETGRHFMRPIAALFDAYLENGPSNSVVEFSRTA
jgi:oxygen-independent coproporphyrinogen-3 oxidase